ncbi:MAG: diaminopimelate decarboxylase, partial [Verrucomicrobiota bacterium]
RSENKFGIALDRVGAVYEQAARLPNILIRGVQMHIGSQITDAAPFAEAIAKVTPLILELKQRYGLEFFSVGGGIGIVYESSFASGSRDWWTEKDRLAATMTLPLTIRDYAAAIVPPLREIGLRV